jgi:hypothetical protein
MYRYPANFWRKHQIAAVWAHAENPIHKSWSNPTENDPNTISHGLLVLRCIRIRIPSCQPKVLRATVKSFLDIPYTPPSVDTLWRV